MDWKFIGLIFLGFWGLFLLSLSKRRWIELAVIILSALVLLFANNLIFFWLSLYSAILFLISKRRIWDWLLLFFAIVIIGFSYHAHSLSIGWIFILELLFFLLNRENSLALSLYSLLVLLLAYSFAPVLFSREFFLFSLFSIVISILGFVLDKDMVWTQLGFVSGLRVLLVFLSHSNFYFLVPAIGVPIIPFIYGKTGEREGIKIITPVGWLVTARLWLFVFFIVSIFSVFKINPTLFLSGRTYVDWAVFLSLIAMPAFFDGLVLSWLNNINWDNRAYILIWLSGALVIFYWLGMRYGAVLIAILFSISLLFYRKRVVFSYMPEPVLQLDIIKNVIHWWLKLSLGIKVIIGLMRNWFVRVLVYLLLILGMVYYARSIG